MIFYNQTHLHVQKTTMLQDIDVETAVCAASAAATTTAAAAAAEDDDHDDDDDEEEEVRSGSCLPLFNIFLC